MGVLKNKKKNEFEDLHNDNIFNDDDDIITASNQRKIARHSVGSGSISAPHALTANEVKTGIVPEEIPMSHPEANSVYKRMKERETTVAETAIDDDYVPSWAAAPKAQLTDYGRDIMSNSAHPKTQATQKKETFEIPSIKPNPDSESKESSDAFLERCRIAVEKATGDDHRISAEPSKAEAHVPAYTAPTSASGSAASKTRSVDEIIRMLRGEQADTEAVAENSEPSVSPSPAEKEPVQSKPVHNESENESLAEKPDSTPLKAKTDDRPDLAAIFAPQPADEKPKHEPENIPMEHSESNTLEESAVNTNVEPKTDDDVRVYGKIIHGSVIQQTSEGDVMCSAFVKTPVVQQAEDKTIMFGDLGDIISQRADNDFAENSDLDELYSDSETDEYDIPYYERKHPEFDNIDDYKDLNDAANLRVALQDNKARQKTLTVFTGIALAALLLLATPIVGNLHQKAVGLIELIIFIAALLFNIDIFADLKNLFTKFRPKFDSCVAFASVTMLAQCLVSCFNFNGTFTGYASAATALLFANRLSHLFKITGKLKGLQVIANSETKRAIVSSSDNAAKTIISGAIDGEVTLLYDRKTVNVTDYMKRMAYDSPFDRKTRIVLTVSVLFALIVGIVTCAVSTLGSGITTTAVLLCCLFPACTAFICELPMYLVAKKLFKQSAMLAGFKGAYELDLSNSIAVNSSDLFPEDSVTLYNMKTLGENELGRTLADAAAVAIKAKSPLANIFKNILGDGGSSLPKVNGVQYEDKMGISGWIGSRTILIGNRNLMQGHNVPVPPPTVDQKILKAGYFPVYIASDGIPCLLLLVKYDIDPDVAVQLRELSNLGMTILVNPTDPNTSDAMICDYFGLPDDAVKVMNHNGRTVYERTAEPSESISAPAAFGKNVCGFFSAVTSAIKLNRIYSVLTAVYIIAAVLGTVLLGYLFYIGNLSLINPVFLTLFELLFVAVAAFIAKVKTK